MSSLLNMLLKYWWLASLMMLAVITVFSLIPLPALPEVPGSDKTHHLVSYALAILPIALRKPRYWLLFAFAIAAWSGGIELVQPFVNRYGEWLDLLANVVGVIIGCVIGVIVNKILIISENERVAEY